MCDACIFCFLGNLLFSVFFFRRLALNAVILVLGLGLKTTFCGLRLTCSVPLLTSLTWCHVLFGRL